MNGGFSLWFVTANSYREWGIDQFAANQHGKRLDVQLGRTHPARVVRELRGGPIN